jgi:hypothetical protein
MKVNELRDYAIQIGISIHKTPGKRYLKAELLSILQNI